MRWLLDHDPRARLRYAPLQGETASALRARHSQIPDELDTVVYVEADAAGERVFLRSDAVLRALAQLEAPWRWLAALRVLPRGLRDAAYRGFAQRRYRWFGRFDACRLPSPEEKPRFLP